MERKVALRMAAVQEQAAKDPRYLALWEEYRTISAGLLALLERLPGEDAAVVEDYLGVEEEMHRRLLEIACQ